MTPGYLFSGKFVTWNLELLEFRPVLVSADKKICYSLDNAYNHLVVRGGNRSIAIGLGSRQRILFGRRRRTCNTFHTLQGGCDRVLPSLIPCEADGVGEG